MADDGRLTLQATAELDAEAVRLQAEALRAYVARGGAASRWLDSKDLTPEDRRRVLLAYGDLEAEG